jgi:hypothetical protein
VQVGLDTGETKYGGAESKERDPRLSGTVIYMYTYVCMYTYIHMLIIYASIDMQICAFILIFIYIFVPFSIFVSIYIIR